MTAAAESISMHQASIQPRAILVLGMHRSGTSAITRVLSLLGADLPSRLQPLMPNNNDMGFWEPAELVVLHDELLAALGSSWDDWRAIPPQDLQSETLAPLRRRILTVLRKDFEASSMFVLKDPRICRFLPVWLEMLQEFGAEASAVITIRNPIEVAGSLKRRDDFPEQKSYLLWLRHMLDAERYSRQMPRCWVSYESLLGDWRAQMQRVAQQTGMKFREKFDQAGSDIDAFLRADHRHFQASDADVLAAPDLADWVREIYAAALELTQHPQAAPVVFDQVEAELAKASGAFSPLMFQMDAELKLSREKQSRLFGEIANLQSALQSAPPAPEEAAAVHPGTAVAVNEIRDRINELNSIVAAAHQRQQILERQVVELQPQLDQVNRQVVILRRRLAETEEQKAEVHEQLAGALTANQSQSAELYQMDWTLNRLELQQHRSNSQLVDLQNKLSEQDRSISYYQRLIGVVNKRSRDLGWALTSLRRERDRPEAHLSWSAIAEQIRLSLRIIARFAGNKARRFAALFSKSRRRALDQLLEQQFIHASGLFDAKYYLSRNPDVAREGADPLWHFVRHGWAELRNPCSLFDVAYYVNAYPDVARAGVNPLSHYLKCGAWERRNPNPLFDSEYYLNQNADVAAAGLNPLAHFMKHGGAEGRKPCSQFDPTVYAADHPECQAEGMNPLAHQLEKLRAAPAPGAPSPLQPPASPARQDLWFDVYSFAVKYPARALTPPARPAEVKHLDIHWVLPPFHPGAGGIMTIVRILQYLERFGHRSTIWINPVLREDRGARDFRNSICEHFLPVSATVRMLPDDLNELSGDVLIATDRWTCYPVRAATNFRRRFYFIQDYETLFYPMGAEALLTENTYHFGFDALCCGPWLYDLASRQFGLRATQFELAADSAYYFPNPDIRRAKNRIAFYARSATPRRACELGWLALEILRQRGVDFHVDFYGQDQGEPPLGYSYTNHGMLNTEQLATLYNLATVGLVFSATNYSIIPREMMACGLPVVELDSPSSRLSFPGAVAELVSPDPVAIANVLEALLADPARREALADRGRRFASQFSWEQSARQVETGLIQGVQA